MTAGKRLSKACATVSMAAFILSVVAQNSPAQDQAQNQSATGKALPPRDAPPYWAYAINTPTATSNDPTPPDTAPRHVPNSEAAFTPAQIHDLFGPPDWHPDLHPAMPDIVARGRKPEVIACGYCHLPNGQGKPENASLAGLPANYIVRQLADFKSGARKSSEPRHGPTSAMITYETKATGEEIQAAAKYFSGLRCRPWIRVLETDTVPRTRVAGWMLVADDAGGTEPIGNRIVETPEDLERTELRDDQSPFIAYVPPGSLKRGETLVTSGGKGRTVACSTCHGPQLKGLSTAPPLAGRSPSYLVRQLYDIQSGARAGVNTHLMKPTVAKLTLDDMIALAAYVASLKP
jgi:cytochrome c553